MNRQWTTIGCLALAAMGLGGLGGCVGQAAHDDLLAQYRTSEEQIVELKAQLEECEARYDALASSQSDPTPDLLARLAQAERDRDAARQALAEAEQKIRDLGQMPGPVLPAALDAALATLADNNPQLMTYDAKRGMVKFRSDLTFDLGSATVKPQAAASLTKLAGVVNSPVAAPYETRIVGHTDNVPIGAATAQKHATNWHLSVHRAIAVKDVLQQAGVAPGRMAVAGRGEHHPVVPNGPRGAEANRRVEIFLVRSAKPAAAGHAGPPQNVAAPPAGAAAPPTPAPAAGGQEDPALFK